MKKFKFKRQLSLVLSGFMSVSLLGGANLKLNAEEGPAQMVRFATKEELMKSENFNLSEVGETENVYGYFGTKAQRVYFGKNGETPQKWYIAGSKHDDVNDHDYLVLFSDPEQPLLTSPKFDTSNRNCDTGEGACVYVDGTTDTSSLTVYSNHYSSSNLRTAIKKLTTERFSEEEQGIMVSTKIYTNDTKNSKVYYNEDILYPAYASGSGGRTIYVGENQADNLDSGISINLNALTGNNFWLRAPYPHNRDGALVAYPGGIVRSSSVTHDLPCGVSASKIDLTSSSLIFASSAPAASSSHQFPEENVMTFRYQDTAEKIKSNAEINDNKITITKGADKYVGVYLYVQGKDSEGKCWVYSQPVTANEEVTAETIGHNADLSQCNVWLEYEDAKDNMVYAKSIQISQNLLSEAEQDVTIGVIMQEKPGQTDDGNNPSTAEQPTGKDDKKMSEIEARFTEIERKLAEKKSFSEESTQIEANKDEQTIDPKPVIDSDFAVFSDSNSESGSGSGFVTSSVNPVTISQPMTLKLLKKSVEFGQKVAKTDSGLTVQVDVSRIENAIILSRDQKDMFKDKDAICLDLTSSGKYDKVETIKYKLGKDLANREFKVYYIYEGKIQLLTESFKLDNEGNIKITSDHGAVYILMSK